MPPHPSYVVHVAEELDVAKTIKYCNEHNLKFLAQSGGNGGADTFELGDNGVLINLRGLNSIVFSEARDQVTLGGGTPSGEWIEASLAHGKQALNGGCNCVGVLGYALGGGVSRWMGHYDMPIDNVLSANLVTAAGELITLSPCHHPELLWDILQPGPNFGVVTSVVMNTFPLIDNGVIWAGELTFAGEKLESVIEVINNLELTAGMALVWGFSTREDGPVITTQVSYNGADSQKGRDAFRALFDLGPDQDRTTLVAYDHINDNTESFCEDGGRKPVWYINFAHGDESLVEIYGESLPRLRELKQKWDPTRKFDQWFPIL